jgi:uncharacterized membrane protein
MSKKDAQFLLSLSLIKVSDTFLIIVTTVHYLFSSPPVKVSDLDNSSNNCAFLFSQGFRHPFNWIIIVTTVHLFYSLTCQGFRHSGMSKNDAQLLLPSAAFNHVNHVNQQQPQPGLPRYSLHSTIRVWCQLVLYIILRILAVGTLTSRYFVCSDFSRCVNINESLSTATCFRSRE